MNETPANSYSYPLGPKVEETPIPVGYVKLEEAVEVLGQAMFPGEWTGEERSISEWNSFGQEFRSKAEFELDREFRDAVFMFQCELECERYGGDPELRYQLRSNFAKGYVPYVPMDDLPPLPPEELEKIEGRFTDKFNLAKAVRDRREKVEDRFLREMLWPGALKAHYVALDGHFIEIEPHIWGGAEGKNYFKYGWVEILRPFGGTSKRPIFILESAVATASKLSPLTPGDGGDYKSSGMTSTGSIKTQTKRQKLLSTRIEDKKVLDKMETLLKNDPGVRSVTAASHAVVDEADGGGTWESRAKRLARKYTCSSRYNPRDPG